MERRTGLERRRDSDSCPLSPECAEKLIKGHEVLLNRVEKMESQLSEIHDRFVQTKGFISGMRLGAASVFFLLASFIIMLYGVLSGKISLKDLITSLL